MNAPENASLHHPSSQFSFKYLYGFFHCTIDVLKQLLLRLCCVTVLINFKSLAKILLSSKVYKQDKQLVCCDYTCMSQINLSFLPHISGISSPVTLIRQTLDGQGIHLWIEYLYRIEHITECHCCSITKY